MRRIATALATTLLVGCGGDGGETAKSTSAATREQVARTAAATPTSAPRGASGERRAKRPRVEAVERDEVAAGVAQGETTRQDAEPAAEAAPAKAPNARERRANTRKRRPAGRKPPRVEVVPAAEAPPAVRDLIGEAKEAIRDIVARTRAGDPEICTERFTLNHVQNSTGKRGDAGLEQCRDDARRSEGLALTLDEIQGVRVVREDLAYVTYTSSIGPASRTQTVVLVREEGRFKLDGGA